MVDERTLIEFEAEYNLADQFPWRVDASEASRKCSQCREVFPAASLIVVKHRLETQPLGHLRLYCPEHASRWRAWVAGQTERLGVVCPNCDETVPLGTGICDRCGWSARD